MYNVEYGLFWEPIWSQVFTDFALLKPFVLFSTPSCKYVSIICLLCERRYEDTERGIRSVLGACLVTSESCIEPNQALVSRPKSASAGLRQTSTLAARSSKHIRPAVHVAIPCLAGSLQYD